MASYALVADADLEDAGIVRHLISSEGVELEFVRDGEAALEVMKRRGAPALLVTELSLPRLDGFALIAELRKRADPQAAPVVALSAFHGLRTMAARMKDSLGLSALLAKPLTLDTLRRAIKRALAQNFSMRTSTPGYKLPPPVTANTQPRIDLAALERERSAAVKRMKLVDNLPPDANLSALLAEAAAKLGAEAAFVSLALHDRHWVKAHAGLSGTLLEERGVRRDFPLCEQVVQSHALLVVPDARSHPLFSDDALVKSGTVRGFAAAPLTGPGGETLGALCLIDSHPLSLTPDGLDALVWLSRRVSGELDLRGSKPVPATAHAAGGEHTRSYLEAVLENIDDGVYLLDPARRVAFVNRTLATWLGREPEALQSASSEQLLQQCARLFDDPAGFIRRVRVPDTGPFLLREELVMQRPERRVVRWVTKPVQLPDGIGHLGVITDITAEAESGPRARGARPHRRAHRARQPARRRGGDRARGGPQRAQRHAPLLRADRPRSPKDHQRHPRPRHRRRCAARGRAGPARLGARRRPGGALGRRRVPLPPAADRARGRALAGRARASGHRGADRHPRTPDHLLRRGRTAPGRRRRRGPRARRRAALCSQGGRRQLGQVTARGVRPAPRVTTKPTSSPHSTTRPSMTHARRLAALSLLALCSALPARADWSGTLQVRTEPKGRGRDGDMDGRIFGSGAKLRIEIEQPQMGKMATVIDLKAHKTTMIMESRHAFTTIDMDKAEGRSMLAGIHCQSEDAAGCLSERGFTKTGVETVNGRKSDRWEHDRVDAQGGKTHETLWIPQGAKGFALIKQVTRSAERTTTLDVLDFKEGSVPADQFEVPAGYTDMSSRMQQMGPPGAHP